MVLKPLDERDPRLRQACAQLSKSQLRTKELQLEIDAILSYMFGASNKHKPGIEAEKSKPNTVGLSANQVGIMKQICAVDLSIGRTGYTDVYLMVNPIIIWRSKSIISRPEGCINFHSIWGVTRRSKAVRVLALDRSGHELQLTVNGWAAILMQHEVDHLNGRLFIDRLPDPTKAHLVLPEQYSSYRRGKPEQWSKFVDVTSQALGLPNLP